MSGTRCHSQVTAAFCSGHSLPLQFLLAVQVICLKVKTIKPNKCKGFSKTRIKSIKATYTHKSIRQYHNFKLQPMPPTLKREAITFWCYQRVLKIYPYPSISSFSSLTLKRPLSTALQTVLLPLQYSLLKPHFIPQPYNIVLGTVPGTEQQLHKQLL